MDSLTIMERGHLVAHAKNYRKIQEFADTVTFPDISKENMLFITVRFSPMVKIPRVRTYQKEYTKPNGVIFTKTFRRKNDQWKMYGVEDQVQYLSEYFDTVYSTVIRGAVTVIKSYEMSDDGTCHLHSIVISHDKYNDYDLRVIRNTVIRHGETMRHIRNGKDYCNNIVIVNDSLIDRLIYLFKDHHQSKKYYLPSVERITVE